MKRLVLASAAVALAVAAWSEARAACPRARDNGKVVSVQGTISKIRAARWAMGDGSRSTHVAELRGCADLFVLLKGAQRCKAGGSLTARGKFFFCNDDDYEDGECDGDELDATSFTCR